MKNLDLTLTSHKLHYNAFIFLNIFWGTVTGNTVVACSELLQNSNLSTAQLVLAIPLHLNTVSIILPFSIQVQTLISNLKVGKYFEVSWQGTEKNIDLQEKICNN